MAQTSDAGATRIVYERKDGTWGWRLRAGNGVVLASHGAQHFPTEREARAMADRVLAGEFKDAVRRVSRRGVEA
jgi:hypothetical protein